MPNPTCAAAEIGMSISTASAARMITRETRMCDIPLLLCEKPVPRIASDAQSPISPARPFEQSQSAAPVARSAARLNPSGRWVVAEAQKKIVCRRVLLARPLPEMGYTRRVRGFAAPAAGAGAQPVRRGSVRASSSARSSAWPRFEARLVYSLSIPSYLRLSW